MNAVTSGLKRIQRAGQVTGILVGDFWVWLVPARLPADRKLPAFLVAPAYAATLWISGYQFQPVFILAFGFSWLAGIWSLSGCVRYLRGVAVSLEQVRLSSSIREIATFGRGELLVAEAEVWAAAAKRDRAAFDKAMEKFSQDVWQITENPQPISK